MSRGLQKNAAFAVAQALISAVSLFVVYRVLIARTSVADVGTWALLMSSTSLVRAGDIGVGAGLARFVAQEHAANNELAAVEYICTALLGTVALYAALTMIFYFPVLALLQSFVGADQHDQIATLLPYAFASFNLLSISAALSSAIDGLQRADFRAKLTIASVLLMVAAALLLIPALGLLGIAVAQVFQYVVLIGLMWYGLRRQLPQLPVLPVRWSTKRMRVMIGFGLKLQAAGIAAFLFEPLTKMLTIRYGGLESLGHYEVAQRLVTQVRNLIIAGSQTLIPAFAVRAATAGDEMRALADKATRTVTRVTLLAMIATVIAAPAVSWLIFSKVDHQFLVFVAMLVPAWAFNTVTAPAYFLGTATGRVTANVVSHVTIGVIALLLALVLGPSYGANGAILASMLALVAGSVIVLFGNSVRSGWNAAKPLLAFESVTGFMLLSAMAYGLSLLT